ncbi:hypothetical protein FDH34_gp462 [Serratia phage BF]|uniref:Uncharacterized protein n=2 Tax=Eneladusvirus BF TaxID=2560751 RepID=A0A7L8ZNV7_9CAUD|nr:hypothetical protein FDH34_gp462 [Serratia phage BF]AQW88983.1 hypothetical protein BF_0458 [Serratia phage BF]QOI71938.1 hypothetical protein pEaSNUABM47_00474 [Erwinia phage pEa_SNUABM_47]QXO12153.1 hypothetical protein pEaSNUABM44_00477 [Erwinia phage pEa_SNUABM_44]QXO12707.1 hypothetical protein pEaSNUABM49_00481 [Erwinia phage pEa_SNUABM_49]
MSNSFYEDLRFRYIEVLDCQAYCNPDEPTSNKHLVWMLLELSNPNMSETKKHRWLGYIQGCMVSKGLINVQEERELTRDVFQGK